MEKISDDCKKLKGKTVIITGSSRGMGRAAALLFGQHGAEVVVNYHSNKDAADKVVDGIKALGSKAIAVKADIGNIKDHSLLIDACLNEFGKLDILYHNAAVHYVCPELDDLTEEVWDMSYDQIIKGPFFLTRLAIPHLKKQPGSNIIFTSTSSAGTATPTDPHYMTAKSAVNTLYKVLAGWLAPEIRVNCVVPGFVKTDMFRHHPPSSWEAMSAMVPMYGMADPLDVAQAALYLASDDASFVTGVDIPVDGGRMAAIPRRAVQPLIDAMKLGTGQYSKEDYGKDNTNIMDTGL